MSAHTVISNSRSRALRKAGTHATQAIPRFGRRGRTAPTDAGFTLIELIVVVIIIGILAAIAIPIFSNQRQRGVDATVTAQVRHVVDAIETAMIDGLGVIDGSHTAGAVSVGASTVTVPTTDGVRWAATGAGLSYCVSGWHDNTNRYTASAPLIWDSSAGGFLPPGAACGSGAPATPILGTQVTVGVAVVARCRPVRTTLAMTRSSASPMTSTLPDAPTRR